jgi:AbrB family looped-hinge helix DNA binding protein
MANAFTVRVDAKGRLSIPLRLRNALDIQPGDTLYVAQEGQMLRYAKAANPFDLLAEHALKDYEAGRTKSLHDFAAENDVVLEGE